MHGRSTHANPGYWSGKMARNRARDADTDEALAAAGWTVVRVWEHEDPVEVAERIASAVSQGRYSRGIGAVERSLPRAHRT